MLLPQCPQISCLTVTQAHRFNSLKLALGDYAVQRGVDTELVVVHDSGAAFQQQLIEHVAEACLRHVRCVQVEPGLTLGELRNTSVREARGDIICQWDDDDRYHPERLQLQCKALENSAAEACFLQDQLHYFPASRRLFWTEWQGDPFPLDVIPGTLMARRSHMPAYPSLRASEDAHLCHSLLKLGIRTERIAGLGWTHVYQFHGSNTWSHQHHVAIAQSKGLNAARLLGKLPFLKQRMSEFQPLICDGSVDWAIKANFLEASVPKPVPTPK